MNSRLVKLLVFKAFATTSLITIINTPVHAYKDCDSAVTDAGMKIQKNGAQLFRVNDFDLTASYELPTAFSKSTSKGLLIALGNEITAPSKKQAQAGRNIMSSPGFQSQIAKSIFGQCDNYKLVTFALFGTDWSESFYLMPSGAIQKGACLSPGATGMNKSRWGFNTCY
jgi:hypothetical protein